MQPPFDGKVKRAPRVRYLRQVIVLYGLGVLLNMVIAWGLAVWTNRPSVSWQNRTAEAILPFGRWTVTEWAAPGALTIESQYVASLNRSWGPEQILGPPDTSGSGDIRTAWASATPDGQPEWLLLDFAGAVNAKAVHVVETYNPGAVYKVSAFSPDGREVVAWEGADPTFPGSARGVSEVPIQLEFAISRVKIYLDSPAVPGWNEIDAVGLTDQQGAVQWATAAQASSTYAGGGSQGSPEALIPRWCNLPRPAMTASDPSAAGLYTVAAGYGWPFLAMQGWEHLGPATITAPPGSPTKIPGPQGGLISPLGWGAAAPFALPTLPARPIPYRPIWTGLLLNALIYGAALWLVYVLLTRPLRVFRELMRLRRGHCLTCGYDLRYDFVRGCPECGWRRDSPASVPAAR